MSATKMLRLATGAVLLVLVTGCSAPASTRSDAPPTDPDGCGPSTLGQLPGTLLGRDEWGFSSLAGDAMTVTSPGATTSVLLPRADDLPLELDGLPIVASEQSFRYERYAYGRAFDSPQSLSAFYQADGIVLRIAEPLDDGALSDSYPDDLSTGRISETRVGTHTALVSHASPDSQGVRPHHVSWLEDGYELNLSAVRSADELVNMARSIVC